MMKWISKAQPSIIITENVYGAPFTEFIEVFEEQGYAATFLRLDSKDFYIPHTRQRGYLVAIRRSLSKSNAVDYDGKVVAWQESVNGLKRPASATLDDYMLRNDDPRVLRGRARLTAESSSADGKGGRAGRTDWTKCETGHQQARADEQLGDKRPLTQWSDSRNTTMPSYAWNEWMNSQVHRIHDLTDINTLRLAQVGVDATYKTMIWNLSQNVDRETMGRLGLSQCLTPSGVPFVSSRGGPLVGEELLLLQGIPVEDLLLTKESETNLKDLAGNAMTTTVVGACMLSALLQGHSALSLRDDGKSNQGGAIVRSLVPPPLLPASDERISRAFGRYKDSAVSLGPASLDGSGAWSLFLADAASSAKKCISEGDNEALESSEIVGCQDCGQTSSRRNACPPRKFEEHDFRANSGDAARTEPSTFRSKLVQLLPMLVRVRNLNADEVAKPTSVGEALWGDWTEQFKNQSACDFRFTRIVRSHVWTAHYVSAEAGRLELRVLPTGCTWLLFGKMNTKYSADMKQVLEHPVARMKVNSGGTSLLTGEWELRLPVVTHTTLSIQSVGQKVKDSWRKRLGLEGSFESEYEFESLKVESDDPDLAEVNGTYKLLPKCGGACGSLRKKIDGTSDMFLFIESGRMTLPQADAYIFSSTCHRTAYGEYRNVVLGIEPEAEYRPICSIPLESYKESVRAVARGRWVPSEGAAFEVVDMSLTVAQPDSQSTLVVPISQAAWETCPELVACVVAVDPEHEVFALCDKKDGCIQVNLQKSKRFFLDMAFALSRLSIPSVVDLVRLGWFRRL